MNLSQISALAALSFFAPSALAGGTTEQGFQQTQIAHPGPYSMRAFTNGDTLTFDGQNIERYAADGSFLQSLASLPAPVFSGLFVIDPTETFAVLGESSTGDVFRIDLATGTLTFLANLFFNYDADFGPDGMLYVSAATGGFSAGNDLIRLDPLTGATTFLAELPGASGPVEFDNFGNIYYATVQFGVPGGTDILIFGAAALASADCAVPATCLAASDAIVLTSGYEGASDMAFDPQAGEFYMVENNYTTGDARIWRLQGSVPGLTSPMIDEVNMSYISGLDVLPGSTDRVLRGFQPESDARLVYNASGLRNQVTAKRASLAISGPGLTGPGLVTLDLTDGSLGGGALLVYGPTSGLAASESPLPIPNFVPLFSDLDVGTAMLFGGPLPFGPASDSTSLSFNNPGSLEGLLSVQAILLNNTFVQLVGTTNRVDF